MPHEHPLGYIIGIEGMALLRAFAGEHDRTFTEQRLDEMRRLIVDPAIGDGVDVQTVAPVDGYRMWARTYDEADNPAFADEPWVERLAGAVPAGVALDAACGTGRLSAILDGLGHRVIGVDSSPDMLEHARRRVPEGDFRLGDLGSLPVDDASVDVAVCGLALTHAPDLDPVFAELSRALRPGASLITTDIHPDHVALGSVPLIRTEGSRPARIETFHHRLGDYIRAALAHGFDVRLCEETFPHRTHEERVPEPMPTPVDPGAWEAWPWSLRDVVPAASAAVFRHVPDLLILHFEKRTVDAVAR